MADLPTILSRKFPGREWKAEGDDYQKLVFLDGGLVPTEAEIRAFSSEVDSELAVEQSNRVKEKRFLKDQGLYKVIEVLIDQIDNGTSQTKKTEAFKQLKAYRDAL